ITDEGVDIDLAMNHLAQMWGGAEGFVYVTYFDRASGDKQFSNSFEYPAGMDDVREYIETHATTRELFYCPFVHASADSKRKGMSVERRWVCIDQDDPMTDPGALTPTITVESGSDGCSHRYFSVPEGVGADEYQKIAQGIGDLLGGCDRSKTTDQDFFRVPGTLNFKHDPPTVCEVVERTDATYTQQGLSVAVNASPSAHTHDRVTGAQNRSQGLQFEPVSDMRDNGTIKGRLNRELERIAEGDDRSDASFAAAKECLKAGYSPGQVATILRDHFALENVREKFGTGERLLRDVERTAGKVAKVPQMDIGDRSELSLLDLDDLLTRGIEPVEWLVPRVFQRGGLYQVVSYAGMGKSLLMLDISQRLARGIEGLPGAAIPDGDSTSSEALTVLYIDGENTRRIIMSRLQEMDVRGLNRLKYASMPTLLPLDTERGGAEFVAHVRHVQAEVVVIDTLSRFVEGDENDAATYAALYRYALAPLRADGVTIIRLDHTGKDQSKGARGSSAKNTDVDGSWIIRGEKNSSRFMLVCDKDRTGDLAPVVPIRRTQEPLGHVATMLGDSTPPDGFLAVDFTGVSDYSRSTQKVLDENPERVREVIAILDRIVGEDESLGFDKAQACLRGEGERVRDGVTKAAVAVRKRRIAGT
ncbi:AAA family ATPase, partial [Dietzia sp. UCD-THP]|uniref:AAA family ATPase n=1 Tax=Dietzia sp. UCD-THP TaxID=1292020 RepID=UPI0006938BEB